MDKTYITKTGFVIDTVRDWIKCDEFNGLERLVVAPFRIVSSPIVLVGAVLDATFYLERKRNGGYILNHDKYNDKLVGFGKAI